MIWLCLSNDTDEKRPPCGGRLKVEVWLAEVVDGVAERVQ